VLAGSRSQPVPMDRAKPSIEAFLVNQRKSELLTKQMKDLREKAKVEYVGKFADKASAPAAGASAPPAAPPASGLDADAISKGMGIK
jgi:hypothetical protein